VARISAWSRKQEQFNRDRRLDRAVQKLRQNHPFTDLPLQVLRGYTDLTLLAQKVKEQLEKRGITDEAGTFSPGIDIFRHLKDSEARYLQVMMELSGKSAAAPKPVLDLGEIQQSADEKSTDEQ
jgi:hypothetical protein